MSTRTEAEFLQEENDDLRALAADIRAHLDDAGISIDPETAAAWWQRAGLDG